jgi:hypothetical protein
VTLEYPEDSLQSVLKPSPWWVVTDAKVVRRGSLIRAFLPYTDQEPRTLIPEGRSESTAHESAIFRIEPLRISRPARRTNLPVAALPTYPGEVHIIQRAKVRPALVVGVGGSEVPKELRIGVARYQTSSTMIVAPYYGADQSGTRGGWRPDFVQRIRRCEYPQYAWDKLPIAGSATESILRLDHLQPLGRQPGSFELTQYCLSEDALEIVDQWLDWLVSGELPAESVLADIRTFLLSLA